jgi:HlyD family type I secretion membrane fusion protein
MVIVAPQSGKITGLQFHTLGGVISPGYAMMEIIPQNDKLIVEAQVLPEDIDIVHEGLKVKVMLSAYSSRFVPRVEGKVVYVSADRFINEHSGEPYYLAKVEISTNALEKLKEVVELYPGMPAEVFIVTGSRTFVGYIMSPILDFFRRVFKAG